jgi:glucokinase
MPRFAIGVDLGGTNMRIAAVDEKGGLLEKITSGTQVGLGRDTILDHMTDAIRTLAHKYASTGALAGIGVGVPGIIDMDTGLLRQAPNLPGWADYPVREEIERRLLTRVVLENDANAAALGESWLGAARDVDSMCMITLGTGVGGGLVLRGRVWHGMTGMAGELGHINVEPEGPPCGCGSRGCLEQFASAKAVERMAREAMERGKAPGLARVAAENPEFNARLVYQMAVQGDGPAQEIFHRVGWALGIVMAGLVNLLNLNMYVVGGGVASAWEAFAPSLLAEVRQRSMVYTATQRDPNPQRHTIITRALLGNDAGLFGAARLPMVEEEHRQHARR